MGIIIHKETNGVKIRCHHHLGEIKNKKPSPQLSSSKYIKEDIRVVVTHTLQTIALIYRKVVQVRGQYPRFQVIQQIYNAMAIINRPITIFQRKFFKNLGNQEIE